MKLRNLGKKMGAYLLTFAMIMPMFPQMSIEVHAAGLPSVSQFATKEQLKTFNTNDQDGSVNPAKVYFGENNQKWWIAGNDKNSQNVDNIVLFAASPVVGEKIAFSTKTGDQTYSYEANTGYDDSAGTIEVTTNHYGVSDVREKLLNLEESYFTNAEQGLMNDTTIYTNDTKNDIEYALKDKLYLAHGVLATQREKKVTIGTNTETNLNQGLAVDGNYWSGIPGERYEPIKFWLRTPNEDGVGILTAEVTASVVNGSVVGHTNSLVPAFELNSNSVFFGSTARISPDGRLTVDDAFTLRYQGSVGTASINQSKGSVAVSGVTNENTYLVVQNSDGAWAKKVANNDLVFASEMSDTLTSFDNCKVWLETTTDRIAYASEATQGNGYNVKVNAGQNMTITNNVQTGISGAITDIIVTANTGYRFPEDYGSDLTLNDLVLTWVSPTEIKLSGTPASDTYIQLPEVEAIPNADTPEVSVSSKTASSVTVEVTNYNTTFGKVQYSTDFGKNWRDGTMQDKKFTITGLQSSTPMTIFVKFTGKGTDYLVSYAAMVTDSTSQASYTISIPATASADGSENEIKVDGTQSFDLGHEEKVSVKIADNGTISNGKLTLTRDNDTENKTVTSALSVNGTAFTDLTQNVALFTETNKTTSVKIKFAAPTEQDIAAGTYTGRVTFKISLVR